MIDNKAAETLHKKSDAQECTGKTFKNPFAGKLINPVRILEQCDGLGFFIIIQRASPDRNHRTVIRGDIHEMNMTTSGGHTGG